MSVDFIDSLYFFHMMAVSKEGVMRAVSRQALFR